MSLFDGRLPKTSKFDRSLLIDGYQVSRSAATPDRIRVVPDRVEVVGKRHIASLEGLDSNLAVGVALVYPP